MFIFINTYVCISYLFCQRDSEDSPPNEKGLGLVFWNEKPVERPWDMVNSNCNVIRVLYLIYSFLKNLYIEINTFLFLSV